MRIDLSTARKLISNYKQNHWTTINNNCPSLKKNPAFPNVQDTRGVWFSLSELQALTADVAHAGGNGVRFYFGEYSADIINDTTVELQEALVLKPGDPQIQDRINNLNQCVGMQTLVMIPTRRDAANTKNCDFNIVTKTSSFTDSTELVAENHGGMIPPPWPVGGVVGQAPNYFDTCGAYFMDL